MVAEIQRQVGIGVPRVIATVLIGTNDAATIVASQSAAESYYADLCTYYAALRTAGAKVIAGTMIPYNANAAYDRTPFTVTSSPYGVTGTFNGYRNYIRALLLNDASKYDAIADYANSTIMAAGWSSTYFFDDAHPNNLGHADMSATLAAVIANVRI